MKIGIRFRVIENNKNLGDSGSMSIITSTDEAHKVFKGNSEKEIIESYDKLKKHYPNAKIIVICETIHWETYEPMSKLLKEDIDELVKKSDKVLKEGLL